MRAATSLLVFAVALMTDKAASLDRTSLRWFYELKGGHVGTLTIEAIRDLLHRGTICQLSASSFRNSTSTIRLGSHSRQGRAG
jgi:hypothetical protein